MPPTIEHPLAPRAATALWTGSSFCTALGLAAASLAVAGIGEQGLHLALLVTARFAFLLFWPAYAGGALVALLGPAFQPVRRHGRELGLAFAAALLVHLGLVAWLCAVGAVPSVKTFVVFGIAAACVYLLTLASIGDLRLRLGAKGWWVLRVVGMNYVAFAFAKDFLRDPFAPGIGHAVVYWPFAALAVAGPGLRLAVWAWHAMRGWGGVSYPAG